RCQGEIFLKFENMQRTGSFKIRGAFNKLCGLTAAEKRKGVVALLLLLLMAFVIWFGKDLMVKVMSYLVWPFIASLVVISL
ncbi:hypothetical protein PXW85_27275, partial [Klebsiella pneumoniae]|nr:hypothetical protein [Klebsiella pneumoniae]